MPRDDDYDPYDPGFDPPPRRRRAARRTGSPVLWALGCLGVAVLVVCGGLAGAVWWAVRPTDFPPQTEDFADARAKFRTALTSTGPSPQGYGPLDLPADADEVEYRSGDLRLKAWASKPAGGGAKQPGVLYLHSGFAFDGRDWDETEPLRRAGFAVLCPILRGENGQPGTHTLLCDEVGDALGAADALAKRPGVDANRLFVAGYSSGGTLAMLAAMADKRFKGCGAVGGWADQGRLGKFGPGTEGDDVLAVPFDPDDRAELAIRSPLAWPNSFKCPARLYVGTMNDLPRKLGLDRLADAARANGQDVQCEEVDGDHQTMVGPALGRVVGFFNGLR